MFAKLVEEVHRGVCSVMLDGVFNHCGSFNKWMDRERIYENQEGYPKGAYVLRTVHIGIFLILKIQTDGRIIPHTMAGGRMIHFQN